MPVLVCLTFADKLYAEHMMEDGKHPSKESMKYKLGVELSVSVSRLNLIFFLPPSPPLFRQSKRN